jgi:hypothetical protein
MLTTLYAVFSTPERLKKLAELKGAYLTLRMEIEDVRTGMNLNRKFNPDEMKMRYMVHREVYQGLEIKESGWEPFFSQKLAYSIQNNLDLKIEDSIEKSTIHE